jgi:hypothetical protein
VSTSVSGIGFGKGSSSAAKRRFARAIAVVAALLIAALAAAPARAYDAVGTVPSQTTVDLSSAGYGDNGGGGAITAQPNPVDATAPADNGQTTPTAQQNNTATNTQTTSTTGGNGGTATGGNAGPSQVIGDGSYSGSHGGNAYANGGNAKSHSSLENEQSNRVSGRDSSGSGYSGGGRNSRGGKDSFVLEPTKSQESGGAAARTSHARLPGLFGLGAASRAIRLEAKVPSGHETAKASPLSGGLPGHGGRLPGKNPFFNLLSGTGVDGAGLILLLLAVLGAAIALPNVRSKALCTPAVPWRPLAYVPPIELPG